MTEGCSSCLELLLDLLTLSKRYRLMSGGGLDRSTTWLSSVTSCPKNRLLVSRCLSNLGASRFSANPCWTMWWLDGSMDEPRLPDMDSLVLLPDCKEILIWGKVTQPLKYIWDYSSWYGSWCWSRPSWSRPGRSWQCAWVCRMNVPSPAFQCGSVVSRHV